MMMHMAEHTQTPANIRPELDDGATTAGNDSPSESSLPDSFSRILQGPRPFRTEADIAELQEYIAEHSGAARDRARIVNANSAKRRRDRTSGAKVGAYAKSLPGTVWSPERGAFVQPNAITQDRFNRIYYELPSDKHRAILCNRHPELADAVAPPSSPRRKRAAPRAEAPPRRAAKLKAKAPRAAHRAARTGDAPTPRRSVNMERVAIMAALMRRPNGASAAELGEAIGQSVKSVSGRLAEMKTVQPFEAVRTPDGSRYFIKDQS